MKKSPPKIVVEFCNENKLVLNHGTVTHIKKPKYWDGLTWGYQIPSNFHKSLISSLGITHREPILKKLKLR